MSNDNISVGLDVKLSGHDKAAAGVKQTRTEVEKFDKATGKAATSAKSAAAGVNQYANKADKAAKKSKKATSSVKSLYREFFSLQGLLAGFSLAAFGTSVVNVGLKADGFQSAMLGVERTVAKSAKSLMFAENEAKRLGFSIPIVTKEYIKLSASAKGSGLELFKLNKIFSSMLETGRIFHMTNDEISGSLNAMSQMLSKSTVQSEELKGQLAERLPGAFVMSSRAMKVTTKDLNKMLEQGQVLANDLLPKLADEMRKTYGAGLNAALAGPAKKLQDLSIAWYEFQRALSSEVINEVASAAVLLTGSLSSLSNNLPDLINALQWLGVGLLIKVLVPAFAKVKLAIAEHMAASIAVTKQAFDEAKAQTIKARALQSTATAELTSANAAKVGADASLLKVKTIQAQAVAEAELALVAHKASFNQIALAQSTRTATALRVQSAATSKALRTATFAEAAATTKLTVATVAQSDATARLTAAQLAQRASANKLSMSYTGLSVAQTKVAATSRVMAVAAGAARSALAFLGGPAGVALLAGFALYQYSTSADEATTSTTQFSRSIDEAVGKVKSLEVTNLTRDIDERTAAIKVLQVELKKMYAAAKAEAPNSPLSIGQQGDVDKSIADIAKLGGEISQLTAKFKKLTTAKTNDASTDGYVSQQLLSLYNKYKRLHGSIGKTGAELEIYNEQFVKTSALTEDATDQITKWYNAVEKVKATASIKPFLDDLKEQNKLLANRINLSEIDAQVQAALLSLKTDDANVEALIRRELETLATLNSIIANKDLVESLGIELAMLQLTERERFIATNMRKLSADATDAERESVKALSIALFESQQTLKDSKDEVDDWANAWEEAAKRVDESFADAWFDALDGKSTDLFDSILSSFKRMLAEMLHLAITKPIVLQITQSLAGGVGSSLLGGAGGLLGGLGMIGAGAGTTASIFGSMGLFGGMSTAWSNMSALFQSGNILAGIGSAIPIATVALGAAMAIDKLTGGGLFGSGWKKTDSGVVLNYSGGQFDGQNYVDSKKKKSLFRGNAYRTEYSDFADELITQINQQFQTVEQAIRAGAAAFNITEIVRTFTVDIPKRYDDLEVTTVQTIDEFLASFSASVRLSLDGLSEEEAAAAVAEWVRSTNDQMIRIVFGDLLDSLAYEGESMTDALLRILNSMNAVMRASELMNLNFTLTGKEAAAAASRLVELTGGLESFTALSGLYYQEFFSAEEQFANLSDSLISSLDTMGITLPATSDGFRELMESIDLNSESGQEMAAILMLLMPQLSDYYNALDDQAAATEAAAEAERELAKARNDFMDNINSELSQFDMSAFEVAKQNISDWYSDAMEQANELDIEAVGAINSLRDKKYLALVESTIQSAIDIARVNLDTLTNNFNTAVDNVTATFNNLIMAIGNVRSKIDDDIVSIRQGMTGFDNVEHYTNQVSNLTIDAGTGTAVEQLAINDEIRAAIINRLQAELAANQLLVDAANQRHDAALAEQENIAAAFANSIDAANDSLATFTANIQSTFDNIESIKFDIQNSQVEFDASEFFAAQVAEFYAQLGSTDINAELATIELITVAVKRRYDAELSANQQLLDAANQRHDAALAEQEKIAAAFDNNVVALSDSFKQLVDNIRTVRASIDNTIFDIQSNKSGFDFVSHYNGQVDDLYGQIGQGDASAQLEIINKLNSAIAERYRAELDSLQQVDDLSRQQADQQQELYQNQLAQYDALKRAADELKKAAQALAISDLSPLTNSEQMSEAKNQFNTLLTNARNGDVDAYNQIQSVGQNYLKIGKEYSPAGYSDLFDYVQSAFTELGNINIAEPTALAPHPSTTYYAAQANALSLETVEELTALQAQADELQALATTEYNASMLALTTQNSIDSETIAAEVLAASTGANAYELIAVLLAQNTINELSSLQGLTAELQVQATAEHNAAIEALIAQNSIDSETIAAEILAASTAINLYETQVITLSETAISELQTLQTHTANLETLAAQELDIELQALREQFAADSLAIINVMNEEIATIQQLMPAQTAQVLIKLEDQILAINDMRDAIVTAVENIELELPEVSPPDINEQLPQLPDIKIIINNETPPIVPPWLSSSAELSAVFYSSLNAANDSVIYAIKEKPQLVILNELKSVMSGVLSESVKATESNSDIVEAVNNFPTPIVNVAVHQSDGWQSILEKLEQLNVIAQKTQIAAEQSKTQLERQTEEQQRQGEEQNRQTAELVSINKGTYKVKDSVETMSYNIESAARIA